LKASNLSFVHFAACQPELMPSFPRYRNMKRRQSNTTTTESKPADFGSSFGNLQVMMMYSLFSLSPEYEHLRQ